MLTSRDEFVATNVVDSGAESDIASSSEVGSSLPAEQIPREEFPDMDISNATIRAAFRSPRRSLIGRCVMKSTLEGSVLFCDALWHCARLTEPAIPGTLLVRPGLWKMFLLLPRVLLLRPPRGGLVPKSRLLERFSLFRDGSLGRSADQAAVASRRRRRRDRGDDPQRRADRVEALVQMGELSAGRHALEGAPIAPGTEATLKAFQDPLKRLPIPRDPLPDDLFDGDDHCSFYAKMFAKNLCVTRNGRWSIRDDSGAFTPTLRLRS